MRSKLVAIVLVAALVPAAASAASADERVDVGRLTGADRIATAVAAAGHGWVTSESVVLASARGFPDALAGGALAAHLDAPLLLSEPDRLPSAAAEEIERLGAAEVVVVGGQAAIDEAVLDAVRALPGEPAVKRVAGADRAATAAEVTRRIAATEVLVASGSAFPDALAGANLLDARGTVGVLLTGQDALPAATQEVLRDLKPQTATVLGGTAAVGEEAERHLDRLVPTVQRLGGADRYATAIAVLDAGLRHAGAPRPLAVASGEDFPDALAAGALAARLDAALLLVPQRRLTDDLDGALRAREQALGDALVVGGFAAVGNHAEAEVTAALAGDPRPGFRGTRGPLPPQTRERMTGSSWRPGCPVGLDELALVELDHWGFDGNVHRGRLVVAAAAADGVLDVFQALFDAGFPLERVDLVDEWGADDDSAMAANATTAFNCRTVAGTDRWSEHAYGTAIDINPVQNPYVRGSAVEPPAGRGYLDRADVRPGMVVRPGPVVDAFASIGWGWGGDFESLKDYQHFSATGR